MSKVALLAVLLGTSAVVPAIFAQEEQAGGVTVNIPYSVSDSVQPPDVSSATFSFDGFGPLRFGMTIAEVRALGFKLHDLVFPNSSTPMAYEDDSCGGADLYKGSDIWIQFTERKLSAISTGEPNHASREGIRVGDTLERVKAIYGEENVVVSDDEYEQGVRSLTVFGPGRRALMVFSSSGGGIVTDITVGAKKELLEGCLL